MKALTTFQIYREKMARESSSAYLFARRPTLPFGPAQTNCPDCQAPLQVYKTQRKTLHTLHLGSFIAHQTLWHCKQCRNATIYAAEELRRLAPAGCTFGYDVLVLVGQALFRRHRRAEEVRAELRERQIRLSLSEVGYLARKFVVYLALAHRVASAGVRRREKIRSASGWAIAGVSAGRNGGGPSRPLSQFRLAGGPACNSTGTTGLDARGPLWRGGRWC